MREALRSILDTIRRLPPDERIAFADEVDRLAWRDRVNALVEAVRTRSQGQPPISDPEVDAIVKEVRAETPLFEQYWTHRRRSAG
jgi:hypothetical protein